MAGNRPKFPERVDIDAEPPLVVPIIVSWNNNALTMELLASLRSQRYPVLRPVVVDNASTGQSEFLARIRLKFPEVSTIANKENMGYAGACNVGIGFGLTNRAEYFLLLNNDVVLDI